MTTGDEVTQSGAACSSRAEQPFSNALGRGKVFVCNSDMYRHRQWIPAFAGMTEECGNDGGMEEGAALIRIPNI